MKPKHTLVLTAALVLAVWLPAAEKTAAGPKGGKLLETAGQRAEFFVNQERKVEINYYDAALQPVAPGSQSVSVIAEPRSGRQHLEFERTSTGFISKSALPEGGPYRLVVQLRDHAEARPQNFRVEFNLETCAGCSRAEYACTCGH